MLCYSCPCELLTFAANGTDSCSFVLVLCAVDLRSRYDWQTVLTLALLFLSCAQLTYVVDMTGKQFSLLLFCSCPVRS
jgi:hypothetical protein